MSNRITKKQIDKIVKNSKVDVKTVFGKCTVVSMQLPNGFVLVESSACVDPENYDYNLGVQICKEKLINRVWELEGYRLQNELSEKKSPLNCKFVVTETDDNEYVTVGKIYEIKNGQFRSDDGSIFPMDVPIRDVDDLKEYFLGSKERTGERLGYFRHFTTKFVVIKE